MLSLSHLHTCICFPTCMQIPSQAYTYIRTCLHRHTSTLTPSSHTCTPYTNSPMLTSTPTLGPTLLPMPSLISVTIQTPLPAPIFFLTPTSLLMSTPLPVFAVILVPALIPSLYLYLYPYLYVYLCPHYTFSCTYILAHDYTFTLICMFANKSDALIAGCMGKIRIVAFCIYNIYTIKQVYNHFCVKHFITNTEF